MIVINNRPGQLGNQLWLNAPYVALCLEYDITFLNLYFENNYHLFENLNCNPKIKFGLFSKTADIYLRKFVLKIIQKVPDFVLNGCRIYVDKKNWRNEKWGIDILATKKNTVFLGGAAFPNSRGLLQKHHAEIRKIFAPERSHVDKVTKKFSSIRTRSQIIIGIHIRKSDYKNFLNGVYYFDDAVYFNYVKRLANMIELKNKRIIFFLSSDEVINIDFFSDYNAFKIDNANNIEDLLALSMCDFIFGVPSTFSMWASFYGKVPLRFFKYENEKINLNEFSKVIAQDLFENGQELIHVGN